MIAPEELDVFQCPLDGINQIEASAGTGKTWNMCGLYLRLLLERRLAVQQILVVTFTKAATAELRERIRSRIVDTLRYLNAPTLGPSDPFVSALVDTIESQGVTRNTVHDLLQLALQSFDEAAIFTIHGFCQRALADAPFAAGMPFATELLTNDSALAASAVHDFWRREISSGLLHPELLAYLVTRADTPEKFTLLLKRHIAKSQSHTVWPDEIDRPFRSRQGEIAAAYQAARSCWQRDADTIAQVILVQPTALKANVYDAHAVAAGCAEWQRYFDSDAPMSLLDDGASKWRLLTTGKLQVATKVKCLTPQHEFFDHAQRLADLLGEAEQDLTLARLHLLRTMLSHAGETLRQAKRGQRSASYDDILFNMFAALYSPRTPWLAAALLKRYPAALIDEFQDTDPLQFAIFDKIYGAGDHPLFLVGDPKQAIYSFRNADLPTYLRARGKATAHYSLAQNQRSSAGLIAAQNALFGSNRNAFILGDLHYQPVREGSKPRTLLADDIGPHAALQIWTLPTEADGAPLLLAAAKLAAERATAAEISRLLSAAECGSIRFGARALQAGDIAVLVKSHAQGAAIRQALAALQIGSVELSQVDLFHGIDAEEVERVLQAIRDPAHTGRLMAALATQMLGWNAHAIDALRGSEAGLQQQIEHFISYRTLWMERGIGHLLRRIFMDEQISRRMLARADGERRMTNLLHLSEHLHTAGIAHPTPDALLRWLSSQRRSASGDETTQQRLESDRNLVQIVTIHRAKGLEYPVVFCPYLWSGNLNQIGARPEGLEYHDATGRNVIDFRPQPDDLDQIKASIKEARTAEFLRLVYVAMTRASQRCYLIVGCYDRKVARGGRSSTESTRSMLNWLVAGDGTSPADWSKHKISPPQIAASWKALAAGCEPHTLIAELPWQAGKPLQPTRPAPDSLNTGRLPSTIRDGWRISSFSALNDATTGEYRANDHDARSALSTRTNRASAPANLAPDDILRFPRGPSAGDTLHAIFETLDFSAPLHWPTCVLRGLRSHPQTVSGVPSDQQFPLQAAMVQNMLSDLMATRLLPGLQLSMIERQRCLFELEFNLPAPRIHAPMLNRLLAEHHYPTALLDFKNLHGYLKGFIDLIFEHQGRFYILDWKSNHLGYRPEDYEKTQLAAAMAAHGYHLQSLLYALALHRYLQRRLPQYDPSLHFGGVLYLFVRGIRPHWRDAAGDPCGVYFHRPHDRVIDALDTLFSNTAENGMTR